MGTGAKWDDETLIAACDVAAAMVGWDRTAAVAPAHSAADEEPRCRSVARATVTTKEKR